MFIAAALFALSAAAFGGAAQLPNSISATDAGSFIGAKKLVCGDVAAARIPVDDADPRLLALAQPFPEPAMIVAIGFKDRHKFASSMERLLVNGTVCVEGKIERVDGHVQMRVSDGSQFKLATAGKPQADFAIGIAHASDTGVIRPVVITQIDPKYTLSAMMAKRRGEVDLEVVVRADGTVGDIGIVRSLDPLFGLDEAAMRAASQWKFRPATRDGQAIACIVKLAFDFNVR